MTIKQIQLANTFDVWRIATNDLISVANDLTEGNLQTSGTVSLTNPSGFQENVSLNVKSGMIYGDGGLLSNVGKTASIVNNKLQNSSISITSTSGQVLLSSSTLNLGDSVYLNVANLSTNTNDTSVANIASANVVNVSHKIATYANTIAVSTQIRVNAVSDTVNAAFVLANSINTVAIAALNDIANNYSVDATIFGTANGAYNKANSANLLAFNTGIGSNAYASGVGANANLFASATIAGANAAIGAGANSYASDVGVSANAYASAVGVAANTVGSSAFSTANNALPNVASQAGVTLTGNLTVTKTYTDQYGKLRLQYSSTPASTSRILSKNDIANLVVMGTNTSSTQSNTYIPENTFAPGDMIRLYNPTSTAQTLNPNVMFVKVILSNSATANSMTGASRNVNANGVVSLYCVADNTFVLDGWAAAE